MATPFLVFSKGENPHLGLQVPLMKFCKFICKVMSAPLLAGLVRLIHLAIVIFIVVSPFMKKRNWMVDVLHVVSVITLVAHWYMDEDTCFLTYLESALRGIPVQESFVYSIVSPVYKISDEEIKSLVMIATPVLGMISFMRILNNWSRIKQDLHMMLKGDESNFY